MARLRNFFKIWLLLSLFLAKYGDTFAHDITSEKITGKKFVSGQLLNSEVDFHIDRTASETIDSVIQKPEIFSANEDGYLNFGYFDRQVWLRFSITASQQQKLLLEFHPYHIDTVALFWVRNDKAYSSATTGVHFLKAGNATYVQHGRYALPFEADVGTTHVYIQLRAEYSSIRAAIKLWKEEDYLNRKISFFESEPFKFIMAGFSLFAAFVGVLLFFYTRSWVYAAYSTFVVSNITLVFTIKGWIIPALPFLTFFDFDLRGFTNGFVVASSAWYFYLLVPKQFSFPYVRKVLLLFIAVVVIVFASFFLLPSGYTLYQIFFYALKPIFIFCVPVYIFHFYYSARKGYSLSWIFLLSITPVVINSVLHLFQILNWMDVSFPNFYWEFAIIFELLLYSVAMGYRYKKMEEESKQLALFLENNNTDVISNLYTIQENERIRIARDLHDSIGQKLSVIKMMLSNLPPELIINAKDEIDLANQMVNEAVHEVRVISHNLIPQEVLLGLIPAIELIVQRMNEAKKTLIDVDVSESVRHLKFDKQKEIAIFRIVQEILNNMMKHAESSNIEIQIRSKKNRLFILIKDNGKGFDVADIQKAEGIGWKNIFARTKMMGGKVDIQSQINKGTQIEIEMPL